MLLKYYSQLECEKYKNIMRRNMRGKHATYDCGGVGLSGLIVGGKEAKPGEYPHLAGKLN